MGLLSQEYYNKLNEQQPAPTPAPSGSGGGPIETIENKIIAPIDQSIQGDIKAAGESPRLTPEQQTEKFGGEVGSAEYYDYQSKHPYKSFLFKGLGEAFGLEFPDQETWDSLPTANKAGFVAAAGPKALAKMVVRAPREIVKAPVRLALSLSPWLDLAKGKITSFDEEAAKPVKQVPWLGSVPSYWQTFDDARKSGQGPLMATLSTGSLALGDITIAASLAEGMKAALQPRAKNAAGPVVNVAPIQSVIAQDAAGASRAISKSAGSASEYYSLPKTVAKEHGGAPGNTFLKVTPVDAAGGQVEVAIVQTRGGVFQKAKDFITRKGERIYEGDFGPEIKYESQIIPSGKVPGGTVPAAEADLALSTVQPKALKGFENKPITGEQISHVGKLAEINKVNPETAQAVMRSLTGKNSIGELTQSEYVKLSQTMAAFSESGRYVPGSPSVNIFSQYGSPQRHWMRAYEEKSGIPLYSEVYTPVEDAVRTRNVFRDSYRDQSRQIFGKYAKPGFAEERRLIKSYMEGDTGSILANEALDATTKTDLVNIANQMRPLYDKLGNIFEIPTDVFLKDYQPHIQNIGGVYQLYKEGSTIPKELTFFAEFKRKGALSVQVDDALALFDIYTNAGSNKMFLNPALQRVNALGESLPPTLKNSVTSYVGEKLGYAGRVEQYLNEIGDGINKKLGWNLPPDVGRQATQLIMDTTYSGALGLRPDAVVRNMLQNPLLTYPRLGPKFYADAVKKALTKEGLAEVRAKGFVVELGLPYGEELAKEVGVMGKTNTFYRNATQKTLTPYASADLFTRSATYWQGKLQWEDSFGKYNAGKLTYEQLEKELDFNALHSVDRNIVRQRLVKGDAEGAFNHYIRDIIDETQFPYRRGASSRVTYGFAGRLGTQFGQWNIEFAHTLGRWVKNKEWDKLIRFHAASTAAKRTVEDTFGFDISKWVGVNPLNPTESPFIQFGSDLMGLMQSFKEQNSEELNKHAEELSRTTKALGRPAGVQIKNWNDFYRSVNRGPTGPDGQYGVYTESGKLKYYTDFNDIWWQMWGFPTVEEEADKQLQKDLRNAKFDYSQRKKDVLELYQREEYDKAAEMISEYGIQITPQDFDAYYIPLNQRTYESLPVTEKARFAPRVFKQ